MPKFEENECVAFSKSRKWIDDLDSLTDEEFDLLIEHAEFCSSHNELLLKIETEFKKEFENVFVDDNKDLIDTSEENEFSVNNYFNGQYWAKYRLFVNCMAAIVLLFSLITVATLISPWRKNISDQLLVEEQKIILSADENTYPNKVDPKNESVNQIFEHHDSLRNFKNLFHTITQVQSDKLTALILTRKTRETSATNKIKPIVNIEYIVNPNPDPQNVSIGNNVVPRQITKPPENTRTASNPLSRQLSSRNTTVKGLITDENGEAVSGADVKLINPDTGFSRTVTTNAQGIYSFSGIPLATYKIEVEAANFKKTIKLNAQALVDTSIDFNLSLEPGDVSAVNDVTSNSIESVINTQDATIGNNFVPEQITQLPTDLRRVNDLLSLQPGVTRQGYVAGGRSDQANITLDGVDVNDRLTPHFYFIGFNGITTDDLGNIRCVAVDTNKKFSLETKARKNLCEWKKIPNGIYDLSIILSKKNQVLTQELKKVTVTLNSLIIRIEPKPNAK